MGRKIRFAFVMFAMALVSLIIYVLLHESGHALVAMLCGAGNVKISVFLAHTWWKGGSFTGITQALCDAAGAALPVCIWWIAMMFYKRERKNAMYQMAYGIFFIAATSPLLAWVLIPAYSMFAPFPDQSDDVVKFLSGSGIPPVIVFLSAIFIIAFNVFIAIKKGLLHTVFQFIKDAEKDSANSEVAQFISSKSMEKAAACVLFAFFIAVLFEIGNSMMAEPILSFTIEREVPETATCVGFDIEKENTCNFRTRLDSQGLLAAVSIVDQTQEAAFQNIIFDEFDSNSTFTLDPGTYTLSVTYLTDADMFERWCSETGCDFEDLKNLSSVFEQETKLSRLSVELTGD